MKRLRRLAKAMGLGEALAGLLARKTEYDNDADVQANQMYRRTNRRASNGRSLSSTAMGGGMPVLQMRLAGRPRRALRLPVAL